VTPEAAVGGPIALIEDGDSITIDAVNRTIDLGISDSELASRREAWVAPAPAATRGLLSKYARLVGSASAGAVTDC
jgi:dihydroxy-acid dehydratase